MDFLIPKSFPCQLLSLLRGLEKSRMAWMGDGTKCCTNLSLPTWSSLPFHPLRTSGRGSDEGLRVPRKSSVTLPSSADSLPNTHMFDFTGEVAREPSHDGKPKSIQEGGMTPSQGRTKIGLMLGALPLSSTGGC